MVSLMRLTHGATASSAAMEQTVADSFRLGFGEPVAVSATTGDGMSDLFVSLQPHIDSVRQGLLHGADSEPNSLALTRSVRHQRHRSEGQSEVIVNGPPAASHAPVTATSRGQVEDQSLTAIRLAIVGLPNAVCGLPMLPLDCCSSLEQRTGIWH